MSEKLDKIGADRDRAKEKRDQWDPGPACGGPESPAKRDAPLPGHDAGGGRAGYPGGPYYQHY